MVDYFRVSICDIETSAAISTVLKVAVAALSKARTEDPKYRLIPHNTIRNPIALNILDVWLPLSLTR